MNENEIKASLLQAQSNLLSYLNVLHTSAKKQEIAVESRWPWKGRIVSVYPKSISQLLKFFLKTLRFGVPEQSKKQYLNNSIESLNIYKQAVQYELLASKPKWLYQEQQQLSKLDTWLMQLNNQIKTQPELSDDQKEALYEWAGCLDDFPTVISSDLLLKILKATPQLQLDIIGGLKQKIQERTQVLPELITQSIAEADEFFKRHGPTGQKRSNLEIAAPIDSLFNFFVTEKGRPEMTILYEQVAKAAMIWKEINQKQAIDQTYQKSLQEFQQFFQKAIDECGPARDLTNGLAYAKLFVLSKPASA